MEGSKNNSEFRIRCVPQSLVRDYKIVARRLGITVAALVKQELRKAMNNFPEEMKRESMLP